MPVHGSIGDGGKKLKACEREERQDTEAIFIDSTSVALLFPAVQHKAHTRKQSLQNPNVDIVHCCAAMAGWDLYCTDQMT